MSFRRSSYCIAWRQAAGLSPADSATTCNDCPNRADCPTETRRQQRRFRSCCQQQPLKPDYLSLADAAAYLGISVDEVKQAGNRGQLHIYKAPQYPGGRCIGKQSLDLFRAKYLARRDGSTTQ